MCSILSKNTFAARTYVRLRKSSRLDFFFFDLPFFPFTKHVKNVSSPSDHLTHDPLQQDGPLPGVQVASMERQTIWMGSLVGDEKGAVVGSSVGLAKGELVGMRNGDRVGDRVGWTMGDRVGREDGTLVGAAVGSLVGTAVGRAVGECMGVECESPCSSISGNRVGNDGWLVGGIVEGVEDGLEVGTFVKSSVGVLVSIRQRVSTSSTCISASLQTWSAIHR